MPQLPISLDAITIGKLAHIAAKENEELIGQGLGDVRASTIAARIIKEYFYNIEKRKGMKE